MFEVFYISTGEAYYTSATYEQALRFVTGLTNCNDYDIRRAEDSWPVVPVLKGDSTRPEGPCWLPCHPRTRAQFKAEMICASNHRLVLTGHRIAADGGVYPSVVCQAPGCGYHEYVRLLGWDGGDLARI